MLEKINWLGKDPSFPPPVLAGARFRRHTPAFINSSSQHTENHPATQSQGACRALLISVNANTASREEL